MPSSSPKSPPAKAVDKPRGRRARLIPLRTKRLAPERADGFEESLHRAVRGAINNLQELDNAIEACHEMLTSIWCNRRGRVGIEWVPERSRKGVFAASGNRPVVYCANGTGRVIKVGTRARRSYMVTELSPADIKLGLARRSPHLGKTEVDTLRKVLVVLRGLVEHRESIRSWLSSILTRANLYGRPNRGAALVSSLCAEVAPLKRRVDLVVRMMAPALDKC
jgi:hypothetical protein